MNVLVLLHVGLVAVFIGDQVVLVDELAHQLFQAGDFFHTFIYAKLPGSALLRPAELVILVSELPELLHRFQVLLRQDLGLADMQKCSVLEPGLRSDFAQQLRLRVVVFLFLLD